MFRITAAATIAFLLTCGPALGAEARFGLGAWRADFEGFVVDEGGTLDFDRDLAVETRTLKQFDLALRLGEGWWPRLTLAYTPIRTRGHQTIEGGPPIIGPEPSELTTDADFEEGELGFALPLGSERMSVSPGFAVRRLKGLIVITDESGVRSRQPYDQVFPLLNLDGQWRIGSRLALNLRGQWIKYRDNSAFDAAAMLQLAVVGPLAIEAGWRHKEYDIAANQYRLDASLSGLVLGLALEVR